MIVEPTQANDNLCLLRIFPKRKPLKNNTQFHTSNDKLESPSIYVPICLLLIAEAPPLDSAEPPPPLAKILYGE